MVKTTKEPQQNDQQKKGYFVTAPKKQASKLWGSPGKSSHENQLHPPEPQEPELQPPPPPIGLLEVMPNPERGPASTYSTRTVPQVFKRPSSTRNFKPPFSKILSLLFGSSRANPNEGPAQPPCIKAIRKAESILFCSRYSVSFFTAWSVTVNSDIQLLL